MTVAQVLDLIIALEPQEQALLESLWKAFKAHTEQNEVAAARAAVQTAAAAEAATLDKP